jgi:ribonuclease HI/pterin-4a-carbinolamine dehydratase
MWQEKDNELFKEFTFKDFKQAFTFMQTIAHEAEERQHHPRWHNEWNKVQIWLSTHEAGNTITEKDRSFAALIDQLYTGKLQATEPPQVALGAHEKVTLYADGGSRGNPGASASGYVLLDEAGDVIVKSGVYLGITTNNQAEYLALKFGLEATQKLGAREVNVFMDSLLVINQMKGIFKVKNRDLWPIHEAIKEQAKTFKKVSYTHVPRELNKLADAEVNETLDAEAKKPR